MDVALPILALLACAVVAQQVLLQGRRRRHIREAPLPASLASHLRARYPELTPMQVSEVLEALRDWFELCRRARRRLFGMPSQAVDEAWHAFILDTRAYGAFCRAAFGRFLHHTPAEAMAGPRTAQDSIKRSWRLACRQEGIDPLQPEALPRLFALDAALAIPDGFHYVLDCTAHGGRDGRTYCGAHVGCGGGCAGGGDGDGCGGGCGGD